MRVNHVQSWEAGRRLLLPLLLARVAAGFPSPADDFLDGRLDLNERLVRHPAATFFVQVEGDSMREDGIHSGDTLVVDRALKPSPGRVVVAVINGEMTVKRLARRDGRLFLDPGHPRFHPIELTPEMEFDIWGVVTFVIHPL